MAASSAQTGTQAGIWIGAAASAAQPSLIRRLMGRWIVRALLAAAGWSALGVLFALPSLGTNGWLMELRIYLAQWWTWGLLTPAIMAADHRLPFSPRELGQRLVAHLPLSVVFTMVCFYLFTVLRATFGVTPWSSLQLNQQFSATVLGWQVWYWLVYWIIVGGLQAYTYYERYISSELRLERLEHSFAEARLNALRMQLDPHFLFNALNTISSHVERDPKLTRRMIEHLGDLLRLSLESRDKQEVPLAEELSFLEHYLAIQKIRFGAHLKVKMQVDPEVRFAAVPALVIQPLVENAIRHGISRRAAGGTVTVQAASVGGRLALRVLDDGVGLPQGWTMGSSAGLGLSITRERIAGLHPNGESRFELRNRAEGGAEVEILLPLRLVGEEEDGRALA
ncbi:MAG TPA: sensor histidine kinase [Terracidiphilus sp.]|jgi:two-component system LytT family sensor kinase|nr:sensor histidine kinase [Terracidiphilus sp.]